MSPHRSEATGAKLRQSILCAVLGHRSGQKDGIAMTWSSLTN